ncbi:hypothetical protein DFH27DRAFT_553090 [Peziza echinospora]|nr:hypothetical protein DFH27DRAFT_553090 [Peziza echinospora]
MKCMGRYSLRNLLTIFISLSPWKPIWLSDIPPRGLISTAPPPFELSMCCCGGRANARHHRFGSWQAYHIFEHHCLLMGTTKVTTESKVELIFRFGILYTICQS